MMNPNSFRVLGRFHMLKELYVNVQHVVQLTAPLPRLHKLGMTFNLDTPLRDFNFHCLLSHAPALCQLELYCMHHVADKPVQCCYGATCFCGLNRTDLEALACLQCQQLDLLTLITSNIEEDNVTLLARIPCPLKLQIDIRTWSCLQSAPLFTLLATLPNLIALALDYLHEASNALWDQGGATLPCVQRLQGRCLPLAMSDLTLPLQSIVSMCPALRPLSLHSSYPSVPEAIRHEVHARFWHAFKRCVELVSLTIDWG